MAVYDYTGKLTDFTEAPFPDAVPRLYVVPNGDAFSPTGPSSKRSIPVDVASNGTFSISLQASIDLVPPTAYTLRCDWFTSTAVGQEVPAGWSEWEFTAQPGGGPIATMPNKITRVWYSTSQPPVDRAGIYWIHPTTGDVKEWT